MDTPLPSMYNGIKEEDMISLTDIAKYKNPDYLADIIKNWLRLRSTIEYLGLWEITNNLNCHFVNVAGKTYEGIKREVDKLLNLN